LIKTHKQEVIFVGNEIGTSIPDHSSVYECLHNLIVMMMISYMMHNGILHNDWK